MSSSRWRCRAWSATGIFTFILAWNDYIFARMLLSADELKTLPIGIADLYNASVVDWGMIMAAGLLVIAPVLGVFVVIQKYMVAGLGRRRRQGLSRRQRRTGAARFLGSAAAETLLLFDLPRREP